MRPANIRHRFLCLFLILFGVALVVPSAFAQALANRGMSIGMVLIEKSGVLRCNNIEPPACDDEGIVVTGTLFAPYYAILCVFNGDQENGVAGLSCGLEYNSGTSSGVEMWGWTMCADGLEFPNARWPEAGGGNILTWNECQQEEPGGVGTGVTAVAGFFYITAYSPDRFEIIENRGLFSGPELLVADCSAAETDIPREAAGWLGFSDDDSEKGELPCLEFEVSETTWGDVKNKYGGR